MERPVIPDETFRQAVALRQDALERLLGAHYPVVYRVACGLCGDERTAAGVVRVVLSRSLHVLTRWRSPADAQNWFLHHTVLAARQARRRSPPPAADLLALGGTAEFVAFVRAVRSLPFQQGEAFVLNHAEELDPRRLAVAQDCSTAAAANHLVAATAALRPIAGPRFGNFITTMAANYAKVSPPEGLVVGKVVRAAGRRRAGRALAAVLAVALAAGVGWLMWHVLPMLVY